MKRALLCEPNISEGQNLDVIRKVADQIRKVEGVKVLDLSSDADHNRSAFTYLGVPELVLEATKAMAAKALKLIDMTKHKVRAQEWERLTSYTVYPGARP